MDNGPEVLLSSPELETGRWSSVGSAVRRAWLVVGRAADSRTFSILDPVANVFVSRHVMTGIGAYCYIVWGIWLRHCLNGKQDLYEMIWPRLVTSLPEVVLKKDHAKKAL